MRQRKRHGAPDGSTSHNRCHGSIYDTDFVVTWTRCIWDKQVGSPYHMICSSYINNPRFWFGARVRLIKLNTFVRSGNETGINLRGAPGRNMSFLNVLAWSWTPQELVHLPPVAPVETQCGWLAFYPHFELPLTEVFLFPTKRGIHAAQNMYPLCVHFFYNDHRNACFCLSCQCVLEYGGTA